MTIPKLMVRSGFTATALLAMLFMANCSSGKKGLPTNLPHITLSSSTATPPHALPSYTYPFDSQGNYVSEWAAEGERRAGRSRIATSADVQRWSSSHGTGSRSRSASSASRKPNVKVTSTSRKKPSTSGARVHTVKKGDSLYAIARRYGSTVAKIKAANGLRSDMIRPGMTLRIPR